MYGTLSCIDALFALMPEVSGWLGMVAETMLSPDGGHAAWADDSRPDDSTMVVAVATMLAALAAAFWWRRKSSQPVIAGEHTHHVQSEKSGEQRVAELRRRHAQDRELDDAARLEELMQIHRLYSRGDVADAYAELKEQLDFRPFELNVYIVCLNMLAERNVKPSPEMLRLMRHAFRQLKLFRPHMWMAIAEYGRRLAPGFDKWDELPEALRQGGKKR